MSSHPDPFAVSQLQQRQLNRKMNEFDSQFRSLVKRLKEMESRKKEVSLQQPSLPPSPYVPTPGSTSSAKSVSLKSCLKSSASSSAVADAPPATHCSWDEWDADLSISALPDEWVGMDGFQHEYVVIRGLSMRTELNERIGVVAGASRGGRLPGRVIALSDSFLLKPDDLHHCPCHPDWVQCPVCHSGYRYPILAACRYCDKCRPY